MKPRFIGGCVIVAVLSPLAALGEVRLPAVFGNEMVLQRDARVPVWGTATRGEQITVQFGDQSKQVSADATGKWRVDLDPRPANASPAQLVIAASNTVTFDDVLVGDVWLCSGQSNMQMGLARSQDGEAVAAKADHPQVRLFNVANKINPTGEGDVTAKWAACAPATVARFSAVGYYFGKELHEQLKVPVGLLNSAWGATGGEAWTPMDAMRSTPALKPVVERSSERESALARLRDKYEADLKAWNAQAADAKAKQNRIPEMPKMPQSLRPENQPGACFDSMIRPLAPFALRGIIWYQGEGNLGNANRYAVLMPALISSWRERWGREELPFGIVQLPNNRPAVDEPSDGDWPRLREAQFKTFRSLPHTGLAITIDIGDALEGHPKNKRDVGVRLARWALADVYGRSLTPSGPVFRSSSVAPGKIVVSFDLPGTGLRPHGDAMQLKGFAVAGEDGVFHWADAKVIAKDRVEVSSEKVAAPKFVRYAWADNPTLANLTNDTELPATPFRTDDLPKR